MCVRVRAREAQINAPGADRVCRPCAAHRRVAISAGTLCALPRDVPLGQLLAFAHDRRGRDVRHPSCYVSLPLISGRAEARASLAGTYAARGEEARRRGCVPSSFRGARFRPPASPIACRAGRRLPSRLPPRLPPTSNHASHHASRLASNGTTKSAQGGTLISAGSDLDAKGVLEYCWDLIYVTMLIQVFCK